MVCPMNRALWLTMFLAACGPEQVAVEQPVTPAVTEEPQVASTTTAPLTGFPCDVRAALQANCASCHTGQTYAPHFFTRDDLLQPQLAQSLAQRLSPTADYPMPPRAMERQPTAAERQVLESWIAAGMPAGECSALSP